ncbi:MAG: metal-sensing transcriptional repressor [Candidatus Moraniibacteriota bacterium]
MENKQKIVIALRKAKTSIEKILERVEKEDAECFPAIQQTLSVIGLLRSANMLMLESHMTREMNKYAKPSSKHMQTLQQEILKIVKTSQNK